MPSYQDIPTRTNDETSGRPNIDEELPRDCFERHVNSTVAAMSQPPTNHPYDESESSGSQNEDDIILQQNLAGRQPRLVGRIANNPGTSNSINNVNKLTADGHSSVQVGNRVEYHYNETQNKIALTIVNVGANVFQFVDFASKLIGEGRGITVEYEDLEAASQSLNWLNRVVSDSMNLWGRPQIGKACNEVTNELLEALQKIKRSTKTRKWTGLVEALRSVWSKSQIDTLRFRLNQQRTTMQSALIVALRDERDNITEELIDQLKTGSELDRIKLEILEAIKQSTETNTAINVAAFNDGLTKMAKKERESHFRSQLLEQLSFQDQMDREHRIVEAHEKTFHWIFTGEHRDGWENKRWSSFSSWLAKADDPLYWVTGKAGSGKSTLMKFIVHNPWAITHLKNWSKSLPIIVARFYFWNSGNESQQSQEGLLRSILYDALKQRPEDIPIIFPRRWGRYILFGFEMRPWTETELVQGFHSLVSRAEGNYKLCLFVDGLDEFDGDHNELITLFTKAVSCTNVKACLSSRPWVVFEEAFMQRPNLMLEDLTYPDIIDYVSTKFSNNSGFVARKNREPDFAAKLIENIADKSSGVFLWVTLVVRSLLSGLSNFDSISDLQRRLDELPGDLENFYQRILDSIEPSYSSQAGKLFQLLGAANGTLTALGLSFADDDLSTCLEKAVETSVGPLSKAEYDYRFKQSRRRLNSRCKGLIEIPTEEYITTSNDENWENHVIKVPVINPTHSLPSNPNSKLRGRKRNHSTKGESKSRQTARKHSPKGENPPTPQEPVEVMPKVFLKVAYLHRTVRDFVATPEIQQKISNMAPEYTPYPPLLASAIFMIKSWQWADADWNRLSHLLHQAMFYSQKVEKSGGGLPAELLDQIPECINELCAKHFHGHSVMLSDMGFDPDLHWASKCAPSQSRVLPPSFYALAACWDLSSYVVPKVLQNAKFFPDEEAQPLLHHIIMDYQDYPGFCEPRFLKINRTVPRIILVQHLLGESSDPNFDVDGETTWGRLLQHVTNASKDFQKACSSNGIDANAMSEMEHWAAIVELFIKTGADPRMNRNSQQGSYMREAFSLISTKLAKNLEKLLAARRNRWSKLGKFHVPPLKNKFLELDPVSISLSNSRDKVQNPNLTLGEQFGLASPGLESKTNRGPAVTPISHDSQDPRTRKEYAPPRWIE